MPTMLERMRAAQKARQSAFETDHSIFIHWKIPMNGSCVLRYIPFEDPRSEGFWTERKMIPVSFLDPKDDSKLVRFQIPCLEMYIPHGSGYCPALAPVRDLYSEAKELKNSGNKAESDRLNGIAGAHWINFTAYYQGWVVVPGYDEENIPENPIRVFPLSKQIHNVIYKSIFDNQVEPFKVLPIGEYTVEDVKLAQNLPEDYPEDDFGRLVEKFNGYNFVIQRTETGEADKKKNKWDGANTGWSRERQPLTDGQLESIEKYGLHDLRKRLPERPSDAQYEVMTEMVKVSIGRLMGTDDGYWNPEWEDVGIKPYKSRDDKGSKTTTTGSAASSAGQTVRDRLNRKSEGSQESAPATSSSVTTNVKDRLAAMKNRGASGANEEEAAAAPAPEPEPAEAPAETPAEPAEGKKKFSSLNAKIREKIEKQQAAESAE